MKCGKLRRENGHSRRTRSRSSLGSSFCSMYYKHDPLGNFENDRDAIRRRYSCIRSIQTRGHFALHYQKRHKVSCRSHCWYFWPEIWNSEGDYLWWDCGYAGSCFMFCGTKCDMVNSVLGWNTRNWIRFRGYFISSGGQSVLRKASSHGFRYCTFWSMSGILGFPFHDGILS